MSMSDKMDETIEAFQAECKVLDEVMIKVLDDHIDRCGGARISALLATVHLTLAKILSIIVLGQNGEMDDAAREELNMSLLSSVGPQLMKLVRDVLAEHNVKETRLH